MPPTKSNVAAEGGLVVVIAIKAQSHRTGERKVRCVVIHPPVDNIYRATWSPIRTGPTAIIALRSTGIVRVRNRISVSRIGKIKVFSKPTKRMPAHFYHHLAARKQRINKRLKGVAGTHRTGAVTGLLHTVDITVKVQ